MARNKKIILLIAVLLVFAGLSVIIESRAPKEYTNYLSQSPAPMGTKAIYTYLENETGKVDRWKHFPAVLQDDEEKELLIMIEPYFTPETEATEAYREFMEAGNTILLFKSNPAGMFDIKTSSFANALEEVSTVTSSEGEEWQAVTPSPVRIETAEQDKVLLSDEAGAIAIERSVGAGSLIVATTPIWMTNDAILEHDHLPLVLELMNNSNAEYILFDEYIHGAGNESTVLTLYPMWFLVLILQGVLLIILWLWYRGKRFGLIDIAREEHVRFSDERIKALAAWYIRGKRFTESLGIQADYVKLLLQEKWGIPYSKEWADSTEGILRKWKTVTEKEADSFVKGLTAVLEKEKMSKQEYLLWSKQLDRLRKEVEEG
ncbi:DUF4350 domain-containing protein [Bacillus sp. AK031]